MMTSDSFILAAVPYNPNPNPNTGETGGTGGDRRREVQEEGGIKEREWEDGELAAIVEYETFRAAPAPPVQNLGTGRRPWTSLSVSNVCGSTRGRDLGGLMCGQCENWCTGTGQHVPTMKPGHPAAQKSKGLGYTLETEHCLTAWRRVL
jgi:hypothetical protein